jgi:hypothetical protein
VSNNIEIIKTAYNSAAEEIKEKKRLDQEKLDNERKQDIRKILMKFGKIKHGNLDLFSDRECINEIYDHVRKWFSSI